MELKISNIPLLRRLVNDETVMRQIIEEVTIRQNRRVRILRAKYVLVSAILFWFLMILILLPWGLK